MQLVSKTTDQHLPKFLGAVTVKKIAISYSECEDDDVCLQEHWGAKYTCVTSLQYCLSSKLRKRKTEMQTCCPLSCSLCGGSKEIERRRILRVGLDVWLDTQVVLVKNYVELSSLRDLLRLKFVQGKFASLYTQVSCQIWLKSTAITGYDPLAYDLQAVVPLE